MQRKGYLLEFWAIILDLVPVLCPLKAGVEIFTGDLISDRFEAGDRDQPGICGLNLPA